MNPEDILKWVETIHQEKNIEKELIFESLEIALSKAAGKKLVNIEAEPAVVINRETGDVTFYEVDVEEVEDEEYNEETGEMEPVIKKIRHIREDDIIPIDPGALGRVAAQTAKQVIIQRIREAERDAIHDAYIQYKGEIQTGTVQRVENNGNIIVTLDNRTEAFFPRWEQVRDEHYDVGERVKALILDVKKSGGQKVKIILSRTHPNFVRKLFEVEVPEIADHTIEIKALVREPGFRSKVAVSSIDSKIDAVGACVGVRGSRIKGIIDELNGEKIDIIRWNDLAEQLIQNALKPAAIASITLDYDNTRARVVVPDDQLSLAIGKGGQNVRLASRLSGWDIDIMSQAQERALGFRAVAKFQTIPDVDEDLARQFFNAGYTNFDQLLEAGAENLRMVVDGLNEERANGICDWLENVDEDEYYREIEVELPPEMEPVSAKEKMERLFGGDGGAGDGDGGEGGPRSATELFRKPDEAGEGEGGGDEATGVTAEGGEPVSADWVHDWVSKLPDDITSKLDAAKEVATAGRGLTPDDWKAIFEARGWSEDDYGLFHSQFEDDDDEYLLEFTASTGGALAEEDAGEDAVLEMVGSTCRYSGITLGLTSAVAALYQPQKFTLMDWTSALLLLCTEDGEGNPNPLMAEHDVSAAVEAFDGWPMVPPSTTEFGEWLREPERYDSFLAAVRQIAESAGVSVHEAGLALWSFALRAVRLDRATDSWTFGEASEKAYPTGLGYDPDFALLLAETEAGDDGEEE